MDLLRKVILPEHAAEAEPPTFWLGPMLAADYEAIHADDPSPAPESTADQFRLAIAQAQVALAIGVRRFVGLEEDGEPLPWPPEVEERQEIVRTRFPLWMALRLSRIYQATGEIATEEERRG